jgi:hypothetical protein
MSAGYQWLTSIILATWETEIGRITIQRQPRQDPNSTNIWAGGHMPVISAKWEAELRRIVVPGQPGKKSFQDPISMEKNSWEWWCMPVIPAMT